MGGHSFFKRAWCMASFSGAQPPQKLLVFAHEAVGIDERPQCRDGLASGQGWPPAVEVPVQLQRSKDAQVEPWRPSNFRSLTTGSLWLTLLEPQSAPQSTCAQAGLTQTAHWAKFSPARHQRWFGWSAVPSPLSLEAEKQRNLGIGSKFAARSGSAGQPLLERDVPFESSRECLGAARPFALFG